MYLHDMTIPNWMGLTKEDKLQDKMQKRQIDMMPVHQPVFQSPANNFFSYYRCL